MTHSAASASLAAAALLLAACATAPPPRRHPPIVFVHGNGDTAALWQTTLWRFESNGWPRDRLHAIDQPYPLARDDDTKAQPGRTSTAEHMAFLKAEVDKVLQATGARQVVLVGNSRGGNAIRNYIQNGGGDPRVSHAVLGGTPNHGVWACRRALAKATSSPATGPFLQGAERAQERGRRRGHRPGEVADVRSDNNDKFAQPDGLWIGQRGMATDVTVAGPELKGATNVVIAAHRPPRDLVLAGGFRATYRFITGRAPATLDIAPEAARACWPARSPAWGCRPPIRPPATSPTTCRCRAPGWRSSPSTPPPASAAAPRCTADHRRRRPLGPVHGRARRALRVRDRRARLRHDPHLPQPLPALQRPREPAARAHAGGRPDAPALVILNRPRGYFDPARDNMAFDGQNPPPGALPGAGVSSSRIKPTGAPRAVVAEFNGERVVGRSWPLAENHVSVLELTY